MASESLHEPFRLGEWRVLPRENRLERGSESVPILPKAMNVLTYLASRRGEVATYDEIIEDVWAPVVAHENSVQGIVSTLRKALGCDAKQPSYIETVHTRGFRLIADIDRPDAPREATRRRVTSRVIGLIAAAVLVIVVVGFMFDTWTSLPEAEAPLPTVSVAELVPIGVSAEAIARAQIATADIRASLLKTNVPIVQNEGEYQVVGTVRRSGDEFVVVVEFIEASTGEGVWATRPLPVGSSAFAKAPFVARRVEGELDTARWILSHDHFSDDAGQAMAAARAAFDAFVSGSSASRDFFLAQLNSFESDPAFLGDLANAYINRWKPVPVDDARDRAYELLAKVRSIDPDATYVTAKAVWIFDLDYDAAAQNFDHSRHKYGPDHMVSRNVLLELCRMYKVKGELERAEKYCKRALSEGVDDFQFLAHHELGQIYDAMGRKYDARKQFVEAENNTDKLTPDQIPSLIWNLYRLERLVEADALLEEAWEEYGDAAPEHFVHMFALLGKDDRARELLEGIRQDPPGDAVDCCTDFQVFWASYFLGRHDDALSALERGLANRSTAVVSYMHNERFPKDVMEDQRYLDLEKELEAIKRRGTEVRTRATECYLGEDPRPPSTESCARYLDE